MNNTETNITINDTDMNSNDQNAAEAGSGAQSLGARILALRKAASMTQEQLAERLGITFQAVSKWENDVACPDVLLLPALADTFGISIDELFGRAAPKAKPAPTVMEGLPWPDDSGLYAVVCKGHTLLSHMQILRHSRDVQRVKVEYRGEALNVTSDFSVEVHGNVAGDVEAKEGVACGGVGGSVTAGDGVACGGVGGNVTAGDSVTCGSVEGDVKAGDSVRCGGSVGGNVTAGDGVTCGDVAGSVHASDSVRCGNISGSVQAGDGIHCTGLERG